MLDFPDSPSVNQIFAPAGGGNWQWTGNKWSAIPTGGGPTGVSSFNTRTGAVILTTLDITNAGGLTSNQSITLSGDISGSGTTSITTTLPSVNANVGTFQGLTINAKGLITAAVNQNYLTANQNITLSGDVSGSGTTSIAVTVAALQGRSVSATAPTTNQLLQWNGSAWTPTTLATGGISDAPSDGTSYGRLNAAWSAVLPIVGGTLTGKLNTVAATTGNAGLTLPHGAAPTAPVNGDLWTTTVGLYARINGSTVGPFGASGSGLSGMTSGQLAVAGSATTITSSIALPLAATNGGTAQSTWTQGDLLYASAANTLAKLAKNATATRYLANTGTTNNPQWDQVNLSNGVTGSLPVASVTGAAPLASPSFTGTVTAVQEQVLGAGQATASINTAGALGGSILLGDTSTSPGNGGMILFSASSATWRFAAIKGYVTDATANSVGDIIISTRRTTGATTLTEAARFRNDGYMILSDRLSVTGTTYTAPSNAVAGSIFGATITSNEFNFNMYETAFGSDPVHVTAGFAGNLWMDSTDGTLYWSSIPNGAAGASTPWSSAPSPFICFANGDFAIKGAYMFQGPPAGTYFGCDTSGNLSWIVSSAQFTVWRTSDWLYYSNKGGMAGYGPYSNLSDLRAKEQDSIKSTHYGLATILDLDPIEFVRRPQDYIEFPKEIGFIAQQVRDVLPEAVRVLGIELPDGTGGLDDDEPSLGISSDTIVAVLVNAVKELAAQVRELQQKVSH